MARVEPRGPACEVRLEEDGWGVAELKFEAFDAHDKLTQQLPLAPQSIGGGDGGHLEVRELLEDPRAPALAQPESIHLRSEVRPVGDALLGIKVALGGPPRRSVKLMLCHVADEGSVINLCSRPTASPHWMLTISPGPAVTGMHRVGGRDGGTGKEVTAEVADCAALP